MQEWKDAVGLLNEVMLSCLAQTLGGSSHIELEAVLSALLIGTFMLLSRFLGEDGIELGFIVGISDSFMMVLLMFGGA